NLGLKCFRPAGHQSLVFRMKLLGHPAHDLAKLFWDRARLHACHLCKHLTVAIALDKLHWNVEPQQTCESFKWHWARKDIAPDHDLVYLCLANILEHRLQCGEVPMNIIERSDPHDRPPLYLPPAVSAARNSWSRAGTAWLNSALRASSSGDTTR